MALKDWLSLLQSLRCEQIVEVQECFWNNPEGYVSIVTEKACLSLQVVKRYYRQNLMESVGNLPESCIFAIIKDVLQALGKIHGMNHYHGYVMPS